MSKKALKEYLNSLKKQELEKQILDLYQRFDDVRIFYNFIFNPREDKLLGEAKFKISKEYFPPGKRKPKARRSIAHKQIKHFITLGVDAHVVAELMIFNIEIAQVYSTNNSRNTEAFTKSMFRSFEQVVNYIIQNGLTGEFAERILKIRAETKIQEWSNSERFESLMDCFE
ncbi:DUF6155 family protein [Gillisia sp. Q332]|uniref:DUF6155 family protein n=1 Tax=Gillisia xinjiangensis TaxID=3384765 RepID=UPI00391BA378